MWSSVLLLHHSPGLMGEPRWAMLSRGRGRSREKAGPEWGRGVGGRAAVWEGAGRVRGLEGKCENASAELRAEPHLAFLDGRAGPLPSMSALKIVTNTICVRAAKPLTIRLIESR